MDKNLTKNQQKNIEKQVNTHLEKNLHKQLPKHLSKHLISKKELLRNQFRQHVTTAIIAAFSFLMALAWKDFIVHIVTDLIPALTLEKHPYLAYLFSALIITIIAVIGIILVTRWSKKPQVLVSESETEK